jgi:hypothetical protein
MSTFIHPAIVLRSLDYFDFRRVQGLVRRPIAPSIHQQQQNRATAEDHRAIDQGIAAAERRLRSTRLIPAAIEITQVMVAPRQGTIRRDHRLLASKSWDRSHEDWEAGQRNHVTDKAGVRRHREPVAFRCRTCSSIGYTPAFCWKCGVARG